MRKVAKYFLILFSLSVHIVLVCGINYVFPSYEVTTVTGMEVRRMDKDGVISKSNPADGEVRDVYFLFTQKPNSNSVMVYRNEDTGWHFPYYFKFDSADIQAKAQAYANDKQIVQIKYYGWRINWMNEFSNILSIKPIKADATAEMPVVSYILYLILALSFFLSIQIIRGWFDSCK